MGVPSPNVAEVFARARQLHRAGHLAEAEPLYREVVAAQPDHADAVYLLGNLLFRLGRDGAEDHIRGAIRLQPKAAYHSGLGVVLMHGGRLDEATECFHQTTELDPELADGWYHLGWLDLLRGNYAEGFRLAEKRPLSPVATTFQRDRPLSRWDGSRLAGRLLFIHDEQGLGDVIQFIRYVPLLLEREPGAHVTMGCLPTIKRLINRSLPGCRVIGHDDPLPVFDVHYPLLSLPQLFGTTLESVPREVPYLVADRDKTRWWRKRLRPGTDGRRVGLVWAGSKQHVVDRLRSLPLSAFAPLGGVSGATFYSLQKGEPSREAADPPQGLALTNLDSELRDMDDTAAAMMNLDLVITVDTSVAHLAGALGRPVWVLLPFVPDWRWLLEREDSPWYPSARLFRQREPGGWSGVVAEVAAALAEW